MRGRLSKSLGVLAVAAAALSLFAMARPAPAPTLDERARQVAETLKCPVCHDMSVADSPAPVAAEMRRQIRERLAAGETPDQVRGEFVAAYGEWILIAPPRRGANWIAWLGPGVLVLLAALLGGLAVRSWTRSAPPPLDTAPHDSPLLAESIAQLRKEVE